MTIVYPEEIRDMTPAERQAELDELETELMNANAKKAVGGAPENPGRIKELRRAIARIKTIQREEAAREDEATAGQPGSPGPGRAGETSTDTGGEDRDA